MTQIGELTIKITGESGELVGTLKASGQGIKDFTGEVKAGAKETKDFSMNLIALNQGVQLVEKGFQLAKQVYNETTQAAINQAIAQKDVARQMGATVEEAGILLQVSDDLRVSQETLVMAFKYLNNAGIQPTFTNLIKIAQQYQALPNSIDKNQFAIKTFGKAGIEMQKILDTNITELKDLGKTAMDSGEILSGPVVDMMERFRKKIKENDDAIKGLKIQIGVGFAAQLEGMLGGAAEINSLTQRIALKNLLNEAEARGIISAKELQKQTYLLATGNETAAQATQFLDEKYKALNVDMDHAIHWIKDHTEAVKKDSVELLTTSDKWLQHMLAEKDVTSQLTAEQNRWAYNQVTLNDLTAQRAALVEQLKDAEQNLSDVQDNWNKSVGQDSLAYLKDYVYNYGPKYTNALQANDDVWGTSSAVQYARNQALKEANLEYAKTGDLEAYKTKLTEIKDTYGPMDDAITAAKDAVLLLKDAITQLQDKIVNINVVTTYTDIHRGATEYGELFGHKEGDPAGGENYWHWNGTAWVVIHGYQHGGSVRAGESVLVGERGPELFTPSMAGDITNNYYSNLTIHSNARTEQVASSFELMRSLNSPGV